MPTINRASGLPPAQQIASHYRTRIARGSLPPGEKLPSAPTAAKDWGVSTATFRSALDLLRAEGLISSRQGQGVFVREPARRIRRNANAHHVIKQLARESEEVRRTFGSAESDLGVPFDSLTFQCNYTEVTPPDDIASLLRMEPNDIALKKMYSTLDGETGLLAQHSVEWIPRTIIADNPALLDSKNEPWPGGGVHQLYTVGVEIDRVDDVITSDMPTPEEQAEWGMDSGTPMLRTRSVTYDTSGRPVRVSDALYPADRAELAFTTNLERW